MRGKFRYRSRTGDSCRWVREPVTGISKPLYKCSRDQYRYCLIDMILSELPLYIEDCMLQ